MNGPIFVIGANRSGTTLLRLILNAHSRIGIPDELIYINSYIAGVPIEQWRSPGLDAAQYRKLVEEFLEDNCSPLHELDIDRVKECILAGPRNFRRPYRIALESWAEHYGKPRWGEKTPSNLFYADILIDMFPDAQFIHLLRDPRAGVASMQKVSFLPDDIVFNALNRHKHMTQGRSILENHVPPPQRHTLRYEDLVRNPAETTRQICEFLEEEYEPEMLSYHENAGRFMKDTAASDYNATATRPISDSAIWKWIDRLTCEEVAIIETICGREMREAGYTPVAGSPSLNGRMNLLIKKAYWKMQTWRHQHIRHYAVKYPMFARSRKYLAQPKKLLSPS